MRGGDIGSLPAVLGPVVLVAVFCSLPWWAGGGDPPTWWCRDVDEWCGPGLYAIAHLFDPEVVVLGGCLAQVWRAAEPAVRAEFERSDLVSTRADAVIRAPRLGDDSPLIGAAELAFEPFLENPPAVAHAGTPVGSQAVVQPGRTGRRSATGSLLTSCSNVSAPPSPPSSRRSPGCCCAWA